MCGYSLFSSSQCISNKISDGEEAILGFSKERLTYEGFNVLIAIDGIEGLKLFNDNQIDLVITDIIMPRKQGIETIIDMQKICPDIKILLCQVVAVTIPGVI